jgi:TolA-binding protein
MSIPYAAGSLYSTAEDLYLWDQALYGEKILSAESKDLMFKPNLNNYGYGFFITKATLAPPTKLAVPVIQHNGGINGFSTTIVRMTNDKRLIVLLDNAEDGQYLGNMTLGIMSVLYDQPVNSPKRSIAQTIMNTIVEKNVASAVAQYRELKAGKTASEYDFGETELNQLGYQLLQTKKVSDAIEIFKLNVEMYPLSSNAYDSLGEGYMTRGDKELSIAAYKKSLELDPKNTNATIKIAALTGEQKEVKVDPKIYDSYAGEYQLAPTFTITITSENGKLMAQATGQSKFELFPSSETDFYIKVVSAQVTFVKDASGNVTESKWAENNRQEDSLNV